jgi:hypothetical protein
MKDELTPLIRNLIKQNQREITLGEAEKELDKIQVQTWTYREFLHTLQYENKRFREGKFFGPKKII